MDFGGDVSAWGRRSGGREMSDAFGRMGARHARWQEYSGSGSGRLSGGCVGKRQYRDCTAGRFAGRYLAVHRK